jgi:putative chitinase
LINLESFPPHGREGLAQLLPLVLSDPFPTCLEQRAYILATAEHETGGAYQPVRERRASADRQPKLRELQDRYWNTGFYGRGYAQITWRRNYLRLGTELAGQTIGGIVVDAETFTRDPDLLLRPEFAYPSLVLGMLGGWYGTKLDRWVRPGLADYVNARRSVNGTDRAEHVAGLARAWEDRLAG